MATISLCMIVKNESDVLSRCLNSARGIADEIIIVDTGSQDATQEIAKQYTEKVYSYPWGNDFAAARNFAFSKASMEYCMWLDADDVIPAADRVQWIELKNTLPHDIDIVMMPYIAAFDITGAPTFLYKRERIVRNSEDYRFVGRVHEAIVPNGTVLQSDLPVEHRKLGKGDPDRNLRIYEYWQKQGEIFDFRQTFYFARELYYHERYEEAVSLLQPRMERGEGWIENRMESCRLLADCWERQGNRIAAKAVLLQSLAWDVPRAEIACDLGRLFMEEQNWTTAIFWYRTALHAEMNTESGGFVLAECYGFLPSIQLCVCYDKIGDLKTAEKYNEQAGIWNPHSEAVRSNRRYFEARKQTEETN